MAASALGRWVDACALRRYEKAGRSTRCLLERGQRGPVELEEKGVAMKGEELTAQERRNCRLGKACLLPCVYKPHSISHQGPAPDSSPKPRPAPSTNSAGIFLEAGKSRN